MVFILAHWLFVCLFFYDFLLSSIFVWPVSRGFCCLWLQECVLVVCAYIWWVRCLFRENSIQPINAYRRVVGGDATCVTFLSGYTHFERIHFGGQRLFLLLHPYFWKIFRVWNEQFYNNFITVKGTFRLKSRQRCTHTMAKNCIRVDAKRCEKLNSLARNSQKRSSWLTWLFVCACVCVCVVAVAWGCPGWLTNIPPRSTTTTTHHATQSELYAERARERERQIAKSG